ncbi:MAG: SWIM zinc finger family protein, partial [Myxococcales bacterium]|nr:SWIM zinc finger family protein [Myxococcales bacterium]
GFLQVQSAALLADATVELAPIDLYNVLRQLRLNADQKGSGRGIRFELVPGEPPRLVLEPWEVVIESAGAPYGGRRARVIRVWGRRRLMLLRRVLPFADAVTVHLLGTGLPSFISLNCGPLTFTLGLTGFTASNWSAALAFDVLLPRPNPGEDADAQAVVAALAEAQVASLASLAKATGLKPADARAALQRACQRGQVMYDVASDRFRHRPLVGVVLDEVGLAFRGEREKQAADLLATADAVKIVREVPHPGSTEVVGDVAVAADGRTYRVSFHLDDEGRVSRIEDTSPFFRQHGLKHGPSAPLIALRTAFAQREAERAANRGKDRKRVQVEARTYTRRHPRGETVHAVSLDRTIVRVRWGERGEPPRQQRLHFDSVADARAAYFERVDALEAKGFLDASAGGR